MHILRGTNLYQKSLVLSATIQHMQQNPSVVVLFILVFILNTAYQLHRMCTLSFCYHFMVL
jgi:hypothetical protein